MSSIKRGLGRGLDALLGDNSITEEKEHLQSLPIEYMQRGKYQPRKDLNPEKLQELADSIKAQGLIQPIVVRRISVEKYEIVAGERRWRASQLAGLTQIPVVIKKIDDRTAMAMALIENIQRVYCIQVIIWRTGSQHRLQDTIRFIPVGRSHMKRLTSQPNMQTVVVNSTHNGDHHIFNRSRGNVSCSRQGITL